MQTEVLLIRGLVTDWRAPLLICYCTSVQLHDLITLINFGLNQSTRDCDIGTLKSSKTDLKLTFKGKISVEPKGFCFCLFKNTSTRGTGTHSSSSDLESLISCLVAICILGTACTEQRRKERPGWKIRVLYIKKWKWALWCRADTQDQPVFSRAMLDLRVPSVTPYNSQNHETSINTATYKHD